MTTRSTIVTIAAMLALSACADSPTVSLDPASRAATLENATAGDVIQLTPLVVTGEKEPEEPDCSTAQDLDHCVGGSTGPECTACEGPTSGGGTPSPGSEPSPETESRDDIIVVDSIPQCSQPQTAQWARAYCRSAPPTGSRQTATQAALDRLARRGGECANLASEGRRLLDAGMLRYFSPVAGDAGGWGDDTIGVILADYWVDLYATTVTSDNRNLDHTLAHEIDHVLNRSHTDASGVETPNSRACSGLS